MTKPYYQDDLITLYHGDCLQVTEWLDADVLVTDPPYGLGGQVSSREHGVHERQTWDNDLHVRDDALAAWGDRPYAVFGSPLRIDAAPPYREAPLVWDKQSGPGMGDVRFPWGRSYELIYVHGDGWEGPRESPILRQTQPNNAARNLGHPTPKPVSLMEALIAKAPPGVIADPFAGTAATLIAARNLGRRAIGVELSETYLERAVNRLVTATPRLWPAHDEMRSSGWSGTEATFDFGDLK